MSDYSEFRPDDNRLTATIKRFQVPFIAVSLAFSTLAFFFALGELSSSCNIAHGQSVCNVGDVETFNDVVTFEDQIQIGPSSAPYAGDWGYRIVGDDDVDTPPEWWLDVTHVKIADETVSASTTLQNDDVLTHTFTATPSLLTDPPNEFRRYKVEALLVINSTTSGDFDFQFNVPTNWDMHGLVVTDLAGTTQIDNFTDTAETTIQTTSTSQAFWIQGVIDPSTSSGTGTVTLQWAQNSAAGDTTLERGSYLTFTELRPDPS